MRNDTRTAFNQFLEQLARLNDVADATTKFSVAPSVQQTLDNKIQESSAFLSKINMTPVLELEGQKLHLGISGPVAGRTDTTQKERQTRDLSGLTDDTYRCEKTDFDTHITYAKLDAWAKFKDFQARIRDAIIKRQALDRMVIGFNGTSVAANTNIANYPMLQDVNKGWLQLIREFSPQRVLKEGATAGKIKIGDTGDYKNLDAAVFDALEMIDPWYREDTAGLVAIVGRKLMHDKYFPLINTKQAPTETLAADIVISQKRIGGLQAATVPYFPAHAILVTTYDNLSIYTQEGSRRRQIVDNAKRDRIEDYQSCNDAYVVEDYGRAALLENIEFV